MRERDAANAAAVVRVDELIGRGATLIQACEQTAIELSIEDRKQLTGAQFVQRRWAAQSSGPTPTPVRAGRQRSRFVPRA